MNTLYYSLVERRDFGDLLTSDGLSRLDTRILSPWEANLPKDGSAVLAVWSKDPKKSAQFPQLLVCPDDTESDWAAWITTFAARIRPFSAYMRLLSTSDFEKVKFERRTPELGSLAWPVAGLVLGEMLAASRLPDKALDTLPATACASTLSFALFRAAAVYEDFGQWPLLVDAWESVRRITKQKPRPLDGKAVARVCATILNAADFRGADKFLNRGNNNLSDICHDLIISPKQIPLELARIPQFEEAEAMMHGSREDRVVSFEKFVRRIDEISSKDSELMSMIIGYLASQIAPGTIRHSSVLTGITHRYPTAALWYGFCAGFGESELNLPGIVARKGIDLPASGRRVLRELLRAESVLDSPFCDIGFPELVALSRTGGDPFDGLITMTPAAATVELAPFVWTVVNVSNKPLSEAPTKVYRDRTFLATLGSQIKRLHETYDDLVRDEGPDLEGEQLSLLSQRRRKK